MLPTTRQALRALLVLRAALRAGIICVPGFINHHNYARPDPHRRSSMGCACCKPKEPAPEAASKSLIKPGSQRSDGTTKPAKPSTRMQIEVVLNQAEQSAGFKVRACRAARILRRARVLSRHTHPRALSRHTGRLRPQQRQQDHQGEAGLGGGPRRDFGRRHHHRARGRAARRSARQGRARQEAETQLHAAPTEVAAAARGQIS